MENQLQSIFIKSNGINIRILVIEKRKLLPVIIFIPGMGCYSDIYFPFIKDLSDRGFNIISIDLDGHGYSEGGRGNFRFNNIISTVSSVVSYAIANYSDNIGLMGTSLGGTYALYTGLSDNRIKSLFCHCAMDISKDLHVPTRYPILFKILLKLRFFAYILPDIPLSLRFIVNWSNVVDGNKILLKELYADNKMTWYYTLKSWNSFLDYNIKLSTNALSIPFKLVVGENDLLFPPSYCNLLLNSIDKSNKLVIIKNGGHFLPFNKKDELIKLAVNWFSNSLQGAKK
jgi:pimeloyl-ACP methyl ester carboxylesterase